MARAIALRPDVSAAELRRLTQRRTSDGGMCAEAARFGLTPQIVGDWVVRFRAEGPAGLLDGTAAGRTPRLLPSC